MRKIITIIYVLMLFGLLVFLSGCTATHCPTYSTENNRKYSTLVSHGTNPMKPHTVSKKMQKWYSNNW